MSSTSKLRWALYEGVYQPALVFPPEELGDAEIPVGYSVVYLLGLDTNAVVADSDVSDYNDRDTQKMSHPAAAAGVAMAQQILGGFQQHGDISGAGDDAEDGNSADDHNRHRTQAADDEDEDEEGNAMTAADLSRLLDGNDDAGDAPSQENGESAEERRRRHEEKKARKEEKKKAKEAKKAAKVVVKREREEITSAPTARRTAAQAEASDDSEDEDNLLLAAMAIEKKYGTDTSSKKKKKKAAGGGAGSDTDSVDADHDNAEREEKTKGGKRERKAAEKGSWAALEEDLFSDDEDDDNGAAAGLGGERRGGERGLRVGNRMGQALAALRSTAAVHDPSGLAVSCPFAHPYLMEIHYEYDQLLKEAAEEGVLLSMQKSELIRLIDSTLRQKAAQKAFLEAALAQRQHATSDEATENTGSEIDALYEAITKLETPLSIADTVRGLVGKEMPPRDDRVFDREAAARAQRAVQRRTQTFQDASVVTLMDHLRSVDAAPRDDGAEVMRRYIQQRRQHEELKTNFRGLSKTGFYAVPKPMEKWRRARDMMVLANVGAEAQKVLPTSYISQAHSTMLQRMKAHAEKRYDRMAVAARDGASFLDMSSFTNHSGSAGLHDRDGHPSSGAAASSLLNAQQVLLQQQQQRLAASSATQRREAFFQFHNLRCDTETPATLETVALNGGFGAAGMSQNVLASVEDVLASATTAAGAWNAGQAEDSVNADDAMSQRSYSVHSATPSSYAFVFDNEPRARRPHGHRTRGGSVSGYSSDGDAVSARSSRATSVHSEQSESAHLSNTAGGGGEGDAAAAAARRANGEGGRGARKTRGGTAGGKSAPSSSSSSDWRSNAKRSIMEQLTLYCRGRGGKPAILTAEQCRDIGRTLLQRAMQAEAERQGVSLAVQSNNLAAPFTKTTEQRLKKSVDHYLERRMAQNTLAAEAVSGEGGVLDGGVLGAAGTTSRRDTDGVLANEMDEGVLGYDAAARQRAVADTPVYEN